MNLLLGLYARRVADGQWRDYAIDHGHRVARFSVFRNANEAPLFTIAKHVDHNRVGYVVTAEERQMSAGASLSEALLILDPAPRLVRTD